MLNRLLTIRRKKHTTMIFVPEITVKYPEYFQNLLNISASLLGILIAATTFILQSGFQSFKFSRVLFLEYYVKLSKVLFSIFGYFIFISIKCLYFDSYDKVGLFIHLIYSIMFIKYLLDYFNHKGLILVHFSTKFAPAHYSSIRRYFRLIYNLGYLSNVLLYSTIFLFTFYPLFVSFDEVGRLCFNSKSAFLSSILLFLYSVIILIKIMPDFFEFNYKEQTSLETPEDITEEEGERFKSEQKSLRSWLIKMYPNFYNEQNPPKILDKELINILYLSNNPVAHFNITVKDIDSSDTSLIRREIENYAFRFYKILSKSRVDINTFILSFHITLKEDTSSRNIFLRLTRTELEDLITKNLNPRDFVKNIKNRVIDDLFKNI